MISRTSTTSSPPHVPGFEVLNLVGAGGMGEVYAARQLALGRLVAIKFLGAESGPESADRIARFDREAKLMARVSHPNVVSIYDFGTAEGHPYLVMEYVGGGELRSRMRPGRPLPIGQVLAIVPPVAEALAHLHRQGILHRDLKPENILLQDDGTPKVTDFGIAVLRAVAGSLTRTGQAMGSLGYVPPEQQYGLKVDERADQYSLAALAYEMLTGQKPLGVFKPPSYLNPRLDDRVDAVILRGLQESPKDRYPTVREFSDALVRALSGLRPRRIAGLAIPAAAVALVVPALVAAALWATGRPDKLRQIPPSPAVIQTPVISHPSPIPQKPPKDNVAPVNPPSPKPQPAPEPIPPGPAKPAPEPRTPRLPPPEERSANLIKIIELRAVTIWHAQGSPKGAAGEAVKDKNWFEAEVWAGEEISDRAYRIWESQGKPGGKAGQAVAKKNWLEAERQLLLEMGGKPIGSPPKSGRSNAKPGPVSDVPPPKG